MLSIRNRQMEVLEKYMLQSFEDEMVTQLRKKYPDKFQEILADPDDDEPVRELIRDGIEHSRKYNIRAEPDVRLYIEVMLAVAPRFEEQKKHVWAKRILRDSSMKGDDKIWLIHKRLTVDAQEV